MAKAYIMMNCTLGEEKEVIQSLQKIVGIKEAHGTLGLYDIVAQIECTTDEKIQEIVTQQIRKIPKIHSSMTLTSSESGQLFQIAEKLVGAMLGKNSSQAYVVFHCKKGQEWQGTFFIRKVNLSRENLQLLRNDRTNLKSYVTGGWHYSWMGDVDKIKEKFICHTK